MAQIEGHTVQIDDHLFFAGCEYTVECGKVIEINDDMITMLLDGTQVRVVEHAENCWID